MTVSELSELRQILRENKFQYKVVKNTLARIASEGTPVSIAKDSFKGPMGIAISYDDPILTVKKVLEYSKKNEKLKVKGAIIEGKMCDPDELKVVAEMPPRSVLLSMLAGCFAAPLTKMANALNATIAKFAYVLEAVKNKKSEG
jgi:large subunit ribosomal protein L10